MVRVYFSISFFRVLSVSNADARNAVGIIVDFIGIDLQTSKNSNFFDVGVFYGHNILDLAVFNHTNVIELFSLKTLEC